ncbi:pinensin family lanthipeptide [Roseivirga sp. BDSF3-8]|uniref:pinensin family lanthipeptide n=1 Tax=Roseivirga sp. BDSF3-8 TaxID=3241598 RepID=UPI003531A5B4
MKKMRLNDLKLSSFVTGMEANISKTAKGGGKTDQNDTNCSAVDICPTARCTALC